MKTTIVLASGLLLLTACGSSSTDAKSTSTSPSSSSTAAAGSSTSTSNPAVTPASTSTAGTSAAAGTSSAAAPTGKTFTQDQLSALLAKTPRASGGTMKPMSNAEITKAQGVAKSAATGAQASSIEPAACAELTKTSLGAATTDKLTGESMSMSQSDMSMVSYSSFRTPELARTGAAIMTKGPAQCPTMTMTTPQGKATVKNTPAPLTIPGATDAMVVTQTTTVGSRTVKTVTAHAFVGQVLVQSMRLKDGNVDAATKDLTSAVTTLVAASH